MYDYSLRRSGGRKFSLKLAILAFLFLLLLFVFFQLQRQNSQKKNITSSQLPIPKNSGELALAMKKIIDKKEGNYSVYFEDFSSGETLGINEEMVVTAASVNKIPILAALYYLAEKGELNLEKKITIQKKDIQDYGTGIIRYQKPGKIYSLKTLARLMMEKSDNTASYILGKQVVGLGRIQQLLNSWGLRQTKMEENKTSNKDMAKLLKLMFAGKIVGESLKVEMLGFMDDSDFEDRLPALLPKEVDVYHKIGNGVGFVHDVGIIILGQRAYYFGVLTSDIPDEAAAKKTIAKLSKLVFAYQTSKLSN